VDAEFVRQLYDFELDRQDKIIGSLSLPFGALTALGGLIGVMMQGFSYQHFFMTRFFLTIVVFALISYGLSVYFLIRCYFGQFYEYIPRPGELKAYYNELLVYYEKIAGNKADAAAAFAEYLEDKLIKAADRNGRNNDEKSSFRYRANWSLVAVLIFTIVSGLPYLIDVSWRKEKVPTVHIDNFDKLTVDAPNRKD
jgi:hypothetical protein